MSVELLVLKAVVASSVFVVDARMLMFMMVHRAKSIEAERQCHVFGWSRHCEEYDGYDSAGYHDLAAAATAIAAEFGIGYNNNTDDGVWCDTHAVADEGRAGVQGLWVSEEIGDWTVPSARRRREAERNESGAIRDVDVEPAATCNESAEFCGQRR